MNRIAKAVRPFHGNQWQVCCLHQDFYFGINWNFAENPWIAGLRLLIQREIKKEMLGEETILEEKRRNWRVERTQSMQTGEHARDGHPSFFDKKKIHWKTWWVWCAFRKAPPDAGLMVCRFPCFIAIRMAFTQWCWPKKDDQRRNGMRSWDRSCFGSCNYVQYI